MSRSVYSELKKLAAYHFRGERTDHTLQPTALVHEVFLRLAEQRQIPDDRPRFVAAASRMIRRVLVDHARGVGREKRGADWSRISLCEQLGGGVGLEIDVLALHEAMEKLAILDQRQSRVVELRFFGGLSVEEAALELNVSVRTLAYDWRMARAWLERELAGEDPE